MDTVHIPLVSGKYPNRFALVDAADADRVRRYTWHVVEQAGRFYVYTAVSLGRGHGRRSWSYPLHRFILGLKADDPGIVDHKDGDGLNNTRANIRPCTYHENACNRGKPKGAYTSIYKGVSLDKRTGTWRAQIGAHGVKHYLGTYPTQIEAAHAYDAAARQLHGEFAHPNFL